jgi:hypothetical protein
MSELVRVRLRNAELNLSRVIAEEEGLTILDEPIRKPDGTLRPQTRRDGRRSMPKTTVAKAAASKKRGGQSTPNAEEAPA